MDSNLVKGLSEIERKTLSCLGSHAMDEAQIAEKSGAHIDAVRRAVTQLSEKGLADLSEMKNTQLALTAQGKAYKENMLPEQRMLEALLNGAMTFKEIKHVANLNDQELNVALGWNKKKNYIIIIKEGNETKAMLTEAGKGLKGKLLEEQILLEKVSNGNILAGTELEKMKHFFGRGILEEKEQTQRKIAVTKTGEEARKSAEFTQQRSYDIQSPVPEIFGGKKQPYIQFLNIVRRKLTELGFKEMESPLVVPEFYNFDVLFQPQNHPARTWTDTYQLKGEARAKLNDRRAVQAIKSAHETGGVSGSTGWGYSWSENIASKIMPAAHGTAHTARQLTKLTEKDLPCKYFTIARCFRPDVLDATHLIEFNQTDGFILGDNLNFRHQLGVLEQFAKEIAGAEEVKFLPDYYPFTEPSVQLSAKHPKLGWVELGGAGMLRPEILRNLGIKCNGFAWGIGIDRLAMFKLGIKDIRYLFSDDLNWLRSTPTVMG